MGDFHKDIELMAVMMGKVTEMLDNLRTPELKLSFVCTLFDHVCETEGFDKKNAWKLIETVNADLGGMYDMVEF